VAFGQYRGEHQLRRRTGWRRRGNVGNHVTGDPVGHLIPQPGIELRRPGQELACDLGLAAGQAGVE